MGKAPWLVELWSFPTVNRGERSVETSHLTAISDRISTEKGDGRAK